MRPCVVVIAGCLILWSCLGHAGAAEPLEETPVVLFRESFDDSQLLKRGWYDGNRFTISTKQPCCQSPHSGLFSASSRVSA
ncbi:MAG: hypothetical protein KDB11_26725 [Planctomycetales bacterium]|nr:hypothetical protein [Planctomycetales bacterium]